MSGGISKALLHIDSFEGTAVMLDRVADFVQHAGATLAVAIVTPELPFTARHLLPPELVDMVARQQKDDLSKAVEYLAGRGVAARATPLAGKPAVEVIREVQRGGYDLLFRPHGVKFGPDRPRPYGPIDMQLLRRCPVPVWLVTGRACRHIVAAIDPTGGPDHEALDLRILDLALRIADVEGAAVTAVHAWDLFGESVLRHHIPREELAEYLRRSRRESMDAIIAVLQKFGPRAERVQARLVKGDARIAVPRAAQAHGADLVVMGTLGRKGVPGYLIGNTAEAVLGRLRCSLVAVKPEGFVSPIGANEG